MSRRTFLIKVDFIVKPQSERKYGNSWKHTAFNIDDHYQVTVTEWL